MERSAIPYLYRCTISTFGRAVPKYARQPHQPVWVAAIGEGFPEQVPSILTECDGVTPERDGVMQKCDGVMTECDGVMQKCDGVMKKRDGVTQKCDGVMQKCDGVTQKCDGDLTECDGDLENCDGDLTECDVDLEKWDGVTPECDGVLSLGAAPSSRAEMAKSALGTRKFAFFRSFSLCAYYRTMGSGGAAFGHSLW